MTIKEQEILSDPSASRWIKEQVVVLKQRDPVDVLNELEVLVTLTQERLGEDNTLGSQCCD